MILHELKLPAAATIFRPRVGMRERLPQLDGVRGIAILLVILHNTQSYPLPHLEHLFDSGWMGVDLFFVLSGFLITRILLDTKESEGYFKNFYARRCLRIWPLYYALLAVMFVLVPLVRPLYASMIFGARSSPWWAYPLFLQNFLVPIPANAAGPLGVTWSLAIEEQFYFAWPWVLRYCTSSQLRRIAAAVICLSPLARLYLSSYHVVIYSNLFCRLDGLMAGALLALTFRSQTLHPSRFTSLAWVSFLLAAPLALLTDTVNARWIVHSLAVMAAGSFVYLALFSAQKWLQAVLTSRFLVYTGTISYGLYLLHKLPFDVAEAYHLSGHPFAVLLMGFGGSYALAALSWSLLEQPFLRLKRSVGRPTSHTANNCI